jgi:lauroyl/myristoyl acyltransferase
MHYNARFFGQELSTLTGVERLAFNVGFMVED